MQNVIVYGNGDIGKKIVGQSINENIQLILDQKVKKGTKEIYKGIEVVNPEDYLIKKRKDCIVVIAVFDWIPIANYLEEYGLSLGRDFVPYRQFNNKYIDYTLFCKAIEDSNDELIALLTNGRKVVMCFGMCHMTFYKDALSNSESFNNEYVFVDVPLANEFDHMYYGKLYKKDIWKFCDVLICNQIEKSIYGEVISTNKILSLLSDRTKVITVTGAQFIGFFPQIQSLKSNIINDEMTEEFSWGDKFINKMCKKGLSADQIYLNIQNTDYLNAEKIAKYFKDAMDNMLAYEKKCDVKIADYISSNYKDKLLYYSPTHLTEDAMCEISRRILCKLEIECDSSIVSDIITATHEVPIYPSVIYALELNKSLFNDRMYNPGDYYNDKDKIDLKEYVYRYCELYKKYGHSDKNYD